MPAWRQTKVGPKTGERYLHVPVFALVCTRLVLIWAPFICLAAVGAASREEDDMVAAAVAAAAATKSQHSGKAGRCTATPTRSYCSCRRTIVVVMIDRTGALKMRRARRQLFAEIQFGLRLGERGVKGKQLALARVPNRGFKFACLKCRRLS